MKSIKILIIFPLLKSKIFVDYILFEVKLKYNN